MASATEKDNDNAIDYLTWNKTLAKQYLQLSDNKVITTVVIRPLDDCTHCVRSVLTQLGLWRRLYDCSWHHLTARQEKPTNCGTKAADVLDKFFQYLIPNTSHYKVLLSLPPFGSNSNVKLCPPPIRPPVDLGSRKWY